MTWQPILSAMLSPVSAKSTTKKLSWRPILAKCPNPTSSGNEHANSYLQILWFFTQNQQSWQGHVGVAVCVLNGDDRGSSACHIVGNQYTVRHKNRILTDKLVMHVYLDPSSISQKRRLSIVSRTEYIVFTVLAVWAVCEGAWMAGMATMAWVVTYIMLEIEDHYDNKK